MMSEQLRIGAKTSNERVPPARLDFLEKLGCENTQEQCYSHFCRGRCQASEFEKVPAGMLQCNQIELPEILYRGVEIASISFIASRTSSSEIPNGFHVIVLSSAAAAVSRFQ